MKERVAGAENKKTRTNVTIKYSKRQRAHQTQTQDIAR